MSFLLIVVISLVVLGVVAALLSGGSDEPVKQAEGGCASCSSRTECKLAELKEEGRRKKEEACHGTLKSWVVLMAALAILAGCSTKNNTAKTRW